MKNCFLLIFLLISTCQLFSQNSVAPSNWAQDIIRRVDRGDDINFRDSLGKTFVLNSVIYGEYKTTDYLIKKGADINITDLNGTTTLMYAASKGDVEIAQLLLKNKVDCFAKVTIIFMSMRATCIPELV